jgi:putative addiction module component (TIGR02574 family)
MSKTDILALREELKSLPATTRALLASDLLESLDEDGREADAEKAWAAEAERRLDEVLSGRVKTTPGEAVLKRVRNRKR